MPNNSLERTGDSARNAGGNRDIFLLENQATERSPAAQLAAVSWHNAILGLKSQATAFPRFATPTIMRSIKLKWTTFFFWIIATGVGLALPAISMISVLRVRTQIYSNWQLYALPVAMAASMGTAQWIVLRRHYRNTGYWIPATAVGGGIAFLLGIAMAFFLLNGYLIVASLVLGEDPTYHSEAQAVSPILYMWTVPMTLIGIIMGFILGVSQWLALRRFVSSSFSWPFFSAAGFALTPMLIVVGPFLHFLSLLRPAPAIETISLYELRWFGGAFLAMLMPGLMTGAGLLRFLSDPSRASHRHKNRAS